MGLNFLPFIALGLFLTFLITLRFYFNVKKKCAGFPFVHFLPSLIFDHLTGKMPKDIPINSVIFQRLVKLAKEHSKEGLFMIFLIQPALVIFSEEAIKVFANEKAAKDKSPGYKIVKEFLGDGIVTSNGSRWKTHRKMINPAFHMGMLKEKIHLFNEHAMVLIKDMEKCVSEPYVDLSGSLKKHYFNALCESVFGLKETDENKARILRIGECVDLSCALVVQRIFSPWLYVKFLLPLFPTGRRFNQTIKEIDDIVNHVISEMKTRLYSSSPTNTDQFSNQLRKSFAYILLNQHLNDPSFTLKDVHDEAKTILIAGYDTVTWSTMWCLYLLGLHPEIQEKAFEEIMSKSSYFITYQESSNLEFLNAIIMETLRIYTVIPLVSRTLSEDVQFGKYRVSKDTTVLYFPYMSHRDPNIFPDPEKFDPERFLSSDSKKSYNFMPFSEGSRSCIGKNYAIIEMSIFLSHILRNFQIISLDQREDVSLSWGIVMTPSKSLRMKIVQRQNSFS